MKEIKLNALVKAMAMKIFDLKEGPYLLPIKEEEENQDMA